MVFKIIMALLFLTKPALAQWQSSDYVVGKAVSVSIGGVDFSTITAAINAVQGGAIDPAVGASTATLSLSTAAIRSIVGNIGTSTGTLQIGLNNVSLSTASIATSTGNIQSQVYLVGTSTNDLQGKVNNIAASTATIAASTGTLQAQINNVGASTNTIQTNVGASTNSLQVQMNAVEADTATIATSTGNLQSQMYLAGASSAALQVSLNNVSLSTASIAVSTGALSVSTASLAGKFVTNSSSMTINAALFAKSFTISNSSAVAISSAPVFFFAMAVTTMSLTTGDTIYSFVPDSAITIRKLHVRILGPGVGGGGDRFTCNTTDGITSTMSVTSPAASAKATRTFSPSAFSNVAAGTEIFCHVDTTAAPKPAMTATLEYMLQ